jgi:hypothetical protein
VRLHSIVLLLTGVLLPAALRAQRVAESQDRELPGPFVMLGGGVTSSSASCEACVELSGTGLSLRSSLGWRLSPRLAVAVEIDGEQRTDAPARYHHVQAGVVASMRVGHGLTARFGVGRGLIAREVATGSGSSKAKGSGTGILGGIAYEYPISGKVIVGPYVDLRRISTTDLERDGAAVVHGYMFFTVDAGVMVGWSLRSLLWRNSRDRTPE